MTVFTTDLSFYKKSNKELIPVIYIYARTRGTSGKINKNRCKHPLKFDKMGNRKISIISGETRIPTAMIKNLMSQNGPLRK